MIVTYLRSSSWGSHDFCPMKYFAVYGLGWQEIPKCKTENGTITHKVLEILGKIKKCKQDGLDEYDDDIMGKINIHDYDLNHITDVCFAYYYNKSANTAIRKKDFAEKGFCPENFHHIFHKDFCKKDFFVKGKFVDGIVAMYPQLAAKLLDIRANPTNYSMDDFVHLYRSAYLQDCHSWVDKAITFDGGRFDPRNHHIVDAEIRFDVEIMQPWAMYDYNGVQGLLALKGTIDQVNQVNESTYEILDWKTGRKYDWGKDKEKTYETLQDDPQLRMYHYVCHKLFPHIDNIFVTIYFINDGGPISLCYQKSDLPKTEAMIREKFEQIKNTEIPAQHKSWKCKAFCHFGRNSFEGTNVKPITEFRQGQMANVGQPMTMCDQIAYCLQHRPMESVMKNMSAPEFSIDFYKAPGT